VLAGVLAGLIARGTAAIDAAVWAVYLHAQAGLRLSRRVGPLGFLARELPGEVPLLMHSLASGEEEGGRTHEAVAYRL
jgi:NAD(P)H-hydrate repair Nnr-like enzyme with NAD(P)H-hydrate dehydratase domain